MKYNDCEHKLWFMRYADSDVNSDAKVRSEMFHDFFSHRWRYRPRRFAVGVERQNENIVFVEVLYVTRSVLVKHNLRLIS